MFTPIIRLTLIFVSFIFILLMYSYGHYPEVGIGILTIFLLLWGYFRSGTVYLAFRHLMQGNYAKAEERLNQTKKPRWLNNSQKSYYHFARGLILANNRELTKSSEHFLEALQLGLRTSNDQTIALHQLAEIAFVQKRYAKSQSYLDQAKLLQYKAPMQVEIDKMQHLLDTTQNT
ncbi:MAG: hypothetical protein GY810_26645 [Aureispira sp.]|nr:hypothetical protein [Aureispira sp.]